MGLSWCERVRHLWETTPSLSGKDLQVLLKFIAAFISARAALIHELLINIPL